MSSLRFSGDGGGALACAHAFSVAAAVRGECGGGGAPRFRPSARAEIGPVLPMPCAILATEFLQRGGEEVTAARLPSIATLGVKVDCQHSGDEVLYLAYLASSHAAKSRVRAANFTSHSKRCLAFGRLAGALLARGAKPEPQFAGRTLRGMLAQAYVSSQ